LESLIASGGPMAWMTPAGCKSLPAAKALEMLSEQVR
jgi:hypothetical protein